MGRLRVFNSILRKVGAASPERAAVGVVTPTEDEGQSPQTAREPMPSHQMHALSPPNDDFVKRATEHLNAILNSAAFAPSKRCQQFLRYVVLESLAGRGDSLKERNIAYEVFGKGINFEPGEDSSVRVKAREVRKRLADYYQSAPADNMRIEIPLGGYLPLISSSSEADSGSTTEPQAADQPKIHLSRRQFVAIVGGALGAAGVVSLAPLVFRRSTPLELFWRPVFATKTPLLVFIPVLGDRATGDPSDRVGIGPVASLRRAADFLTHHNYPYHLRFGTDLSFSQLKEQPSLLLGGFSSFWTMDMTRDLRFSFVWSKDFAERAVIDRQTNRAWHAVNPKPNGYADQDYGILCRLFDTQSRQIVMVAGGITTFGTEGAASALFDPSLFGEVVRNAPPHWETKNIEAVVRVSIIGNTPSEPEVVATHFW